MNSICISIEANEEQQEILIAELSGLGAEGFEQTETNLLAYFNQLQFPSYAVQNLLEGYVSHTRELKEENWNAVWENNFPPVIVEDFCVVRADFHEPVATVDHEILIMPKMSFGTGHHATTYMMISAMKDIDLRDKTVFDFGTGTGILAILAEKLGASKITAIDIDEWSIRNARENLERNHCTKTELIPGADLPRGTYEIILANINRNIILEYIAGLVMILKKGGCILMSGLLLQDEAAIKQACMDQGLHLVKKTERNSWIALLWAA